VRENEHRCLVRWDEVPAVAGVRSIQKRQQSAPPYYVFSSDPYPFFQLPPLLLVAQFQPAALCLATTPLLRYAPDFLFRFHPSTVIPSYRNSLLQAGSEWKFPSRGVLIDFFSFPLVISFHPTFFRILDVEDPQNTLRLLD